MSCCNFVNFVSFAFSFPSKEMEQEKGQLVEQKEAQPLSNKTCWLHHSTDSHLQALIRIVEDLHSSCTQAGLPATDRASIVWGTQERCELKQNLLNESPRTSNAFLGPQEVDKFGRSRGKDFKQRLKMIQLGAGVHILRIASLASKCLAERAVRWLLRFSLGLHLKSYTLGWLDFFSL